MAFWIAGDADLPDGAPLQQAAVDHLERAAQIAGGTITVTRDDEEPLDAGLAGELRQEFVKRRCGCEHARGDMRHRAEACRPQPDRTVEHRLRWVRRHC